MRAKKPAGRPGPPLRLIRGPERPETETARVRRGGTIVQSVQIEQFRPESRVAGHETAGGAGGPAVLVVEAGQHVPLFRFVDRRTDAFEPLLPEVRGFEPHPGMHEKSAEPHLVKGADLAAQFLRFQLPIPAPERQSAVLRTRRNEFSADQFRPVFTHIPSPAIFSFFSTM